MSFTFALHPGNTDHTWAEGALDLLAQSPLEIFQLYSVGGGADALEANRLCRQLVEAHGHRMTRFSFSRLLLELSSIRSMCEGCPNLTQLFVFISSRDLVSAHQIPITQCVFLDDLPARMLLVQFSQARRICGHFMRTLLNSELIIWRKRMRSSNNAGPR